MFDPISGPTLDMPIDGYLATASFVQRYPATVAAFRSALRDAWAQSDRRPLVEQATSAAVGVPIATLRLATFPSFSFTVNPTRLQRVADLMASQALLPEQVTVDSLIATT